MREGGKGFLVVGGVVRGVGGWMYASLDSSSFPLPYSIFHPSLPPPESTQTNTQFPPPTSSRVCVRLESVPKTRGMLCLRLPNLEGLRMRMRTRFGLELNGVSKKKRAMNEEELRTKKKNKQQEQNADPTNIKSQLPPSLSLSLSLPPSLPLSLPPPPHLLSPSQHALLSLSLSLSLSLIHHYHAF